MNINTTHIWTDPDRCAGHPCIRGHRFTVKQLLAEIAETDIETVCDDFELTKTEVCGVLDDLAIWMESQVDGSLANGYSGHLTTAQCPDGPRGTP